VVYGQRYDSMDGGGRSRREHAIESNATTRGVYGQSNCRRLHGCRRYDLMDEGGRSRREHVIESNATTRVV
jgi:hypothetical protein